MSESTGHAAMTIAKFLSDAKAERLEVTSDSLVVVDEASMLDLPTLYRILRYLPDGVRILLVGDPAQLAPIGFGLVFHRLVGNAYVPQTHLVQVHRQAEASGIPAVALAMRNHEIPDMVPFAGRHAGVSFIECASEEAFSVLTEVASHWQDAEWQTLAATKGGRGGIRFINAEFHAQACSDAIDGDLLTVGEPVIHLVNDYERGLMNGTLGHVIAVHDDYSVEFIFEGQRHVFEPADVRDRIELAYAISVHKAQGSQFDRVAIVVGRSRLLDHALLYTALTRGIDQVVFIGDRAAFERAVKSPPLARQRSVAFDVSLTQRASSC
jgi:exodeoxyribonuclease V alpha subunit